MLVFSRLCVPPFNDSSSDQLDPGGALSSALISHIGRTHWEKKKEAGPLPMMY